MEARSTDIVSKYVRYESQGVLWMDLLENGSPFLGRGFVQSGLNETRPLLIHTELNYMTLHILSEYDEMHKHCHILLPHRDSPSVTRDGTETLGSVPTSDSKVCGQKAVLLRWAHVDDENH